MFSERQGCSVVRPVFEVGRQILLGFGVTVIASYLSDRLWW